MKTPRELFLEKHKDADTKLQAISANDLAMQTKASASAPLKQRRSFSLWFLLEQFWREAIQPWRKAWIGLSATWLVLLLAHSAADGSRKTFVATAVPPSPQIRNVLLEQKKLLAQLLDPIAPPPRSSLQGPRSDLRIEIVLV